MYLLPHSTAAPAYMHTYTHLLPCEPREFTAFNSKVSDTIWQKLEGKNSRKAVNYSLQAQVFSLSTKTETGLDRHIHSDTKKRLVKFPCRQNLQVRASPFLSTVQKLCVGMVRKSDDKTMHNTKRKQNIKYQKAHKLIFLK